jgi:hypothetical protein
MAQGKLIIIPPDASIIEETTTSEPELSRLQKIVGGYIDEPLYIMYRGEQAQMFFNESSDATLMRPNPRATGIALAGAIRGNRPYIINPIFNNVIYGNAVILTGILAT